MSGGYRGPKGESDLVLELETSVNHHVGAGNQIQLVCQTTSPFYH